MKTNLIFQISKIFGVFPFNGNALSVFWVGASTIIHLYFAYALFLFKNFAMKSNTSDKIDLILFTMSYVDSLLHFVRVIFDRSFFKTFKRIIKRGAPPWLDLALPFGQFVFVTFIMLMNIFHWERQIKAFSTMLLFQNELVIIQYIFIVNGLTRELKKLRRYIGKYPEASCIHLHRLVQLTDKCQKTFSLQLLLLSGLFISILIRYCYGILVVYKSTITIIVIILATIRYVLWILVVLWAPTNFNYQIDEFYQELFRVVWTREDLFLNKKMVLYLTIQRKAKFSVCGFFTIGYPLFTSIIGATVTYLVILIQYKDGL